MSSSVNSVDFSKLPPSCKLQILSLLNLNVQQEVMKADSDDFLPFVRFHIQEEIRKEHFNFFTEDDLKRLDTEGYIIKDDFLGSDLSMMRSEVEELDRKGFLRDAKMISSSSSASSSSADLNWKDASLRGDKIFWITTSSSSCSSSSTTSSPLSSSLPPTTTHLLSSLISLQQELNLVCPFFSSSQIQAHIACYPGEGTRYVRHLDASKKKGSNRRLTCLYYINPNWKPTDGGQLRLYKTKKKEKDKKEEMEKEMGKGDKTEEGTGERRSEEEEHLDVEPLLDRLLIFQSRMLEHEVLPSYANRFALTVWFY